MKQFKLTFIIALFCTGLLKAQTIIDCNSLRYDREVFTSVDILSNVVYGANINSGNANEILIMDIYLPAGDTASVRPLIVWAHGGSFIGGTKNDPDISQLATAFAKRGYVCASISYRLGIPVPIGEANATKAVYRAVQDMKAAVRFFRKDAATTNQYKIDPNMIFAGGSSAGAFTALHLAYLNEVSELPSVIDTTLLGNIEGESGNPGYSSEVNAVVNLCGALGSKEYIVPGDIPFVSLHGTMDQTVPYSSDTIYLLGIFPILEVDGSFAANQYANTISVDNEMYTYFGAGHVPYLSNSSYMDTTVRFVSNFLYSLLSCTPRNPDPLPNTFGTTFVSDFDHLNEHVKVYPNPAGESVIVRSEFEIESLELYDISGRLIRIESEINKMIVKVDRKSLKPGFYLLNVQVQKGKILAKIYFE
ncbi:MAG TPA: T9SS type A sorting domain-containing protein [Bacteroidia bacterium]|nr:T9SS type A sorting domain-containing protein [Bacteroidia bacterium]